MPRNKGNATLKRFYREVKGLQSLDGVSGVLPILAFDDTIEPRWFVMPPAEPLADRLTDADFEVTVEVFARLAEILAHLSNRDEPVFHRDIKPDNLFWYADGPVFGDFGIAHWARSVGVTRDWEKVGPMSYLAPEARWAAQVKDWHAADVYSLTKPYGRWPHTATSGRARAGSMFGGRHPDRSPTANTPSGTSADGTRSLSALFYDRPPPISLPSVQRP